MAGAWAGSPSARDGGDATGSRSRARGRAAYDRPSGLGTPPSAQMRPSRRGRLAGAHGEAAATRVCAGEPPSPRRRRLPRSRARPSEIPCSGRAPTRWSSTAATLTRATSCMRPAVASRWLAPPTSSTGPPQASPCRARPAWAQQTGDYNPWAPSVIEKPQPCPDSATGPCFVMFFTSKHAAMNPPPTASGWPLRLTPPVPSPTGVPSSSPGRCCRRERSADRLRGRRRLQQHRRGAVRRCRWRRVPLPLDRPPLRDARPARRLPVGPRHLGHTAAAGSPRGERSTQAPLRQRFRVGVGGCREPVGTTPRRGLRALLLGRRLHQRLRHGLRHQRLAVRAVREVGRQPRAARQQRRQERGWGLAGDRAEGGRVGGVPRPFGQFLRAAGAADGPGASQSRGSVAVDGPSTKPQPLP